MNPLDKMAAKQIYKYFIIFRDKTCTERFCVKSGKWENWLKSGTEFNSIETARAICEEFNLTGIEIKEMNKVVFNVSY